MYLFVWVDVDVALDALLAHVGPAVARHPLPLALGALVLPETTLLPLVWRQTLTLWTCLQQNNNSTLVLSNRVMRIIKLNLFPVPVQYR